MARRRVVNVRSRVSISSAYQPTVQCLLITRYLQLGWWRDTVVERRSLAGELSLSCARPAADGRPLM